MIDDFEHVPLLHNTPVPIGVEETSHEHLSAHSKVLSDDSGPTEITRKQSLKEKYLNLLDEKQHELEHLKQLADMVLSRPGTSTEELTTYQDFDSLTGIDSAVKQDEEQQTSTIEEKTEEKNVSPNFFPFYELIFKARQAFANVLEQHHFSTFADRLQSFKQMSSDDRYESQTYFDNAETLLKEMLKTFQTAMAVSSSQITDLEAKAREPAKIVRSIDDPPTIDPQHSALIEEKESKIQDLTTKYRQLAELYSEATKEHDVEVS